MSQMQYETTIVIDSLQKSEDMQNMVTKIENFIKNNGGTITDIEEWGKKRLAYEINRKQYGTYFHILFEGPSTLPALLGAGYLLTSARRLLNTSLARNIAGGVVLAFGIWSLSSALHAH